TKATTFDDIGSELNIFDTTTNLFVYRYIDKGRDYSQLVTPGQIVDLHDHTDAQKLIRGSGPEQMTIRNGFLFVSMLHSDKVEVFKINNNAGDVSQILAPAGFEFTGGITPQGLEVSPDGKTVFVTNMQTEDVSFLSVDANGSLTRQGYLPVGVTPSTPDPVKGGNGSGLFATDEEVGLRWFFSSAYADDGPVAGMTPGGFDAQKSCGFCHWDMRQDGCQWNVAANAVGGVKVCPQNKDISDNWPEWYEGLNNDFMAYASACNGEVLLGERAPTPLFPQADPVERFHAREDYVLNKTEENSAAIGRPDLNGEARKVGYYRLAYLQILWSQNETRLLPNPLGQTPTSAQAQQIERGRQIFTGKVAQGGAGCADCHHNANSIANGVPNDTFQDFNIHEPGVISEDTVDGKGPFYRPNNDYFFTEFAPPQDVGTPQNFSSRNTKHLRAVWDATPRYLHHGFAHNLREVLLAPDSPLLLPGERGFNFRTVRTDHSRATGFALPGETAPVLPTQVPITVADSNGSLAGDGKGPIFVSLDSPFVKKPDGSLEIDQLGTSNVAPLVINGQINPALAAKNIQVIKDTHGKTSHLSASDLDALVAYMKSLDRANNGPTTITPDPTPVPGPIKAVSRKTHGAAGIFDVNLPLSGTIGIEPRDGGAAGDFQIAVTFPNAVTVTNASLTTGAGTVRDANVAGNVVTVNLTGVSNAQTVTLKLAGVNDGATTADYAIPMGVLVADANGDGAVNSSDATVCRSKSGSTADSTNFRADFNVDGSINSADSSVARSRSGTGL
ncbi:MAG: dockerin type I domain-containing protein, partial [Chthoniobacterales bacterium]